MSCDLRLQRLNAANAPHRVPVRLANLRQVERVLQAELGQDLRGEHVRQLHVERIEYGDGPAAQVSHGSIGLVLVPLALPRVHGAVASGGGASSVSCLGSKSLSAHPREAWSNEGVSERPRSVHKAPPTSTPRGMSTTAGDGAPAPLTPTPSVRQRTIALESELLQHTCATVTGLNRGRASATSSGTGPGGGEAGPDTPPVLPAARGAEMNGDDASSEAPVVVNVALSDPRAPHLPQASRASPGGGASRGGGDRESAGSLGYADRDAAAAAAMTLSASVFLNAPWQWVQYLVCISHVSNSLD
mmetsp:Transcript_367/g.1332  ORF Transcript_367/g.1332 Transcript_367/m.1332 type:complete len:302 (-) Transcript_367:1457-2362(-)